ncbi:MAG TPA: M48 family metalloprotease [Albitalea sp.]|nr:M48 family metalloprotease [Albitalea sp.]
MNALCTAALALAASATPAHALQLVDEPQGLAWSSIEVAASGAPAAKRVLERAEQAGESGCRTQCELIARTWQRLAAVFGEQQANRAQPVALSLHVVQSADVDAFAVPDGTVVLSEAFVRERGLDAAQLAFVLAHEVAHVLLEHERETLTAALSLLPHNVSRSVDDVYVELDYNLGLLKAIELSMQQAEHEADAVGMQLAALAGYAPAEQLRFMEDEARHEPGATAVVATHPPARSRLLRLQAALPLAQRLYVRALEQRAGGY